jgi:hypothetical protein
MKTTLLMAGAAVVIATTAPAQVIAAAAPAHADTTATDQAFLNTLRQAGLTYLNPDRAISAAKSVCQLADEGMEGVEIVQNLQAQNPGFGGDGAAKFTALAAQAYCPEKLTSENAAPPPKDGNA